ncbi:MAG: PilZ domain-containing protein [Candidatus Omnitrophica bacterium]|jgi:hypothetical protein|nr:PilZ domain-containing protein [Candidatus Omnitrophota bacterium]
MTLKELKKVKEIIIQASGKEYVANIIEIPDMMKIIAAPVSIITDAWMKKPAEIFFILNNKRYSFSAFVYLPSHQKIVIVKAGDITPDKRIYKRTEIDILPATIFPKPILGLLQLPETEVKVVDLSEGGAQIWVKEPLEENKQYILSITLKKHTLAIPCEIRNKIGQKENTFIYGIHFTEISDLDKKIITKYLTKIRGDKKQKNIESIDMESMWNDIKQSF